MKKVVYINSFLQYYINDLRFIENKYNESILSEILTYEDGIITSVIKYRLFQIYWAI